MGNLLWLIPALPLAGFLVLALAGGKLRKGHIAVIGTGAVLVSAVLATVVAAAFLSAPPEGGAYLRRLWRWVSAGGIEVPVTLYFDRLSLVMVLVVAWVGFFIHLYSTSYMKDEEGYGRFFAYMNLFVGSMLVLVLAGDLVPLYAGWEGVGLCSYLLIGFWYEDPANGRAARKAFIVTRVGDAAMAVGLFLLFTSLGTLDIQGLMQGAAASWAPGSAVAVAAAALLLAGALGKSAQLPLQVWLPDAMAGPTPVSALIHAATMVTAGVYLIARTNVIFTLAPQVQAAVAALGVATLLVASFSALVQRDIKRVLAYSTMSQIGYMFLALGVGAYSAAIFHFMTHAFFKALLFLGAGVVIQALGHERDMFKMGGLRGEVPLAFWTFLAGAASLSALPLLTAGYYSKDLILLDSFSSAKGGVWLWAGGLAGAFLTSVYAFRMVFLTFFGESKAGVQKRPGTAVQISLVVLAVLALVGGFIDVPGMLDEDRRIFPPFAGGQPGDASGWLLKAAASLASLAGVVIAYWFFFRRRKAAARISENPLGAALGRLWMSGWGFDWLYGTFIVRPFLWTARINREDFVDLFYEGMAWYSRAMNSALGRTQSGRMRSYAIGIALGAIIAVGIVLLI
jgi:NADH-quinone oxidoreductase subunit L